MKRFLMTLCLFGIVALLTVSDVKAQEAPPPPTGTFGVKLMVMIVSDVHQPNQPAVLGSFTVAAVVCHSPADEAGIMVGDEIVSMNDTDIIGITAHDYNILSQVPVLKMTLVRERQKISVSLTSRELKEPIDISCGIPTAGDPA